MRNAHGGIIPVTRQARRLSDNDPKPTSDTIITTFVAGFLIGLLFSYAACSPPEPGNQLQPATTSKGSGVAN